MLSLQSSTAALARFLFQLNFGISLCKIEKCESVGFFELLMVNASFIKEPKGPSSMVIGTVLIHIQSRHFLEGLINLLSFIQASQSHLILVSVQIAKSKVVIDDDEVLIELPGLCGVIFGQILKSKMVAVD